MLYGIVGSLFAYCVSLMVASPLAAFAMAAGYQVIMFVVSTRCPCVGIGHFANATQLYLAAYLLTLTYAKTSQAGTDLTIIRSYTTICKLS